MDLRKELRIIVKYILPKEQHDKDVIENYVDTLFLINEEYIKQLKLNSVNQCVPYQKCPKCDGQGIVSKPPYIAGDVFEWLSTSVSHTCDVCNGSKIIPEAHCG